VEIRLGAAPRPNHDVNPGRQLLQARPKRLTHQPLPPIASDSAADFARNRQSEPGVAAIVFANLYYEYAVGGESVAAINAVEINPSPKPVLAQEPFIRHV
jgi:hypothetical protein